MRTRILQGRPFSPEEIAQILEYCMSDVDRAAGAAGAAAEAMLLRQPGHLAALGRVRRGVGGDGAPRRSDRHGNRQPAAGQGRLGFRARRHGAPDQRAIWRLRAGQRRGLAFSTPTLFEAYCAAPASRGRATKHRQARPARKTFDSMAKAYPQIESLRQLRHTRNKMRKVKLAVGSDGRNRTVLWPFAGKTARSQPKASEWIFSPAVWLRFLDQAGARARCRLYRLVGNGIPDRGGAVRTASRCSTSTPPAVPYIGFAKRFDEAPPDATKKSHRISTSATRSAASARSTACSTSRWRSGWAFRRSRPTRC